MKKFTLQLQNINGEIESEEEVVIGDDNILVMQYPEDITMETAYKMFDMLKRAIEKGGVVGLPNTITFKVIKKETESV